MDKMKKHEDMSLQSFTDLGSAVSSSPSLVLDNCWWLSELSTVEG